MKPRHARAKVGTCAECGEKVPLVLQRRNDTWVIGFHHGNRRGIGAGCSGVGYEPRAKP